LGLLLIGPVFFFTRGGGLRVFFTLLVAPSAASESGGRGCKLLE
jgi:hypothetical protein